MTYVTPQQAWVRSLKREVTILTLVFMGLQVLTNLFSVAVFAVFSGSLSAPAASSAVSPIGDRLALMQSIMLYFFMFALPIGFYFLITYRQPAGEYFKCGRPKFWYTAGGAFGVVAINYVASILSDAGDLLFHRAGLLESAGGMYAITDDPVNNLLVLFALVIFPAFMEEFVFRGIIAGRLGLYNKGMAVVVSALLFGLIHMTAEQIPFAVCAGLLLGYVYLKTQSIWSVVIIHAVNNLMSYISMYWSARTGDAFLAERNFMILFAGLFVVGFISLVVMAVRHRRASKDPLPFGRAVSAAVLHPAFITVAVLCLGIAAAVSALGIL